MIHMKTKLLFELLIISLTFMMLIITPPAAYADDNSGNNGLPSVPVMPTRTGKFPGYHPVNTTGVPSLPTPHPRTGPPPALPTWTSYPQLACHPPSSVAPEGIAAVPAGQVFVDWYTGNLWLYTTVSMTCILTQAAPSGHPNGYWGLAVKGSLVATISAVAEGLWTCTLTSSATCKSPPVFVSLPSSFCATMTAGHCFPISLAFDKAGNIWYVDRLQALEVELTKASGYSKVGTTRTYGCSYGLGCEPIGIVIDSAGNHWVSDFSCTGNVWENGVVKFSAGDEVWGITISTLNPSKKAHLYVAVTNGCGNYPYPFVGDATDLVILPHPYSSGADYMAGISTQLYFVDLADYIWLTAEP